MCEYYNNSCCGLPLLVHQKIIDLTNLCPTAAASIKKGWIPTPNKLSPDNVIMNIQSLCNTFWGHGIYLTRVEVHHHIVCVCGDFKKIVSLAVTVFLSYGDTSYNIWCDAHVNWMCFIFVLIDGIQWLHIVCCHWYVQPVAISALKTVHFRMPILLW